jgi:hypothetical protein
MSKHRLYNFSMVCDRASRDISASYSSTTGHRKANLNLQGSRYSKWSTILGHPIRICNLGNNTATKILYTLFRKETPLYYKIGLLG